MSGPHEDGAPEEDLNHLERAVRDITTAIQGGAVAKGAIDRATAEELHRALTEALAVPVDLAPANAAVEAETADEGPAAGEAPGEDPVAVIKRQFSAWMDRGRGRPGDEFFAGVDKTDLNTALWVLEFIKPYFDGQDIAGLWKACAYLWSMDDKVGGGLLLALD